MTTKPNQTAESPPEGNELCLALKERDDLRAHRDRLLKIVWDAGSELGMAGQSIDKLPGECKKLRADLEKLRSRVAELEANEQPTLRDRLAMAALQGLLASDTENTLQSDVAARLAYETADLALKVRNQQPAEPK